MARHLLFIPWGKFPLKNLLIPSVIVVSLAVAPAAIADRGGRGHEKHNKEKNDKHGHEAYYFRPSDRQVILTHYQPGTLPPGLAKKLARTGKLPRGWEKRFHPMPVIVERQLPPLEPYYRRGIIDGCAVVYDQRTRVILDVLQLVDDIRR